MASPDRRAEADARAYGADRGADLAPPYDEWQTNGYRDPRNVERDAAALLAVASQMQELFQCQDTLLKTSADKLSPSYAEKLRAIQNETLAQMQMNLTTAHEMLQTRAASPPTKIGAW